MGLKNFNQYLLTNIALLDRKNIKMIYGRYMNIVVILKYEIG
jgi:hypothetical protein